MLRPYQIKAFEAIKADINRSGASLVVMPTGSGKSHVIAGTATLQQPVLILQPSAELLRQNKDKLSMIVPKEEIGVYSASFNECTIKKFTFATINSIYKKPELFQHIKLVIIDEAHLVPVKTLGTMYMSFLQAIGQKKVIGFTASPYRLEVSYIDNGEEYAETITVLKLINRMRHWSHKEIFWKRIIYHVTHRELLQNNCLCPLEYIHQPLLPYASIPINKSHSDYDLEQYSQDIVGLQAQIISTIAEAQRRYKSVLVFCSTVAQAQELSQVIVGSKVVSAKTPKKERAQIVEEFKTNQVKTIFNVSCLTMGFDHPSLDCIILLRPTRSLVLYQQMLGRGTRPAPDKTKCTVIDFTGTSKALGRIETFELYLNHRGLWDLKTEKHDTWNNRILFKREL